jgi:hypothetical protein
LEDSQRHRFLLCQTINPTKAATHHPAITQGLPPPVKRKMATGTSQVL